MAVDSPQAALCDWFRGVSLPEVLALFGGPALSFWLVALVMGARWALGRSTRRPFVVCLLLAVVAPILTAVALSLPSDECSSEDQRASDEWERVNPPPRVSPGGLPACN